MADTYTATVGLNYPTAAGDARIEAGAQVSDLPASSVNWLLSQGLITVAGSSAPDPAPATLQPDMALAPEPTPAPAGPTGDPTPTGDPGANGPTAATGVSA
jgi:hypothetical protein